MTENFKEQLEASEYAADRRMKEIFDARRSVREMLVEVSQEVKADSPKKQQAVVTLRTLLNAYIREVESLMTVRFPEIGKEYWEDVAIGEIVVAPPDFSDYDYMEKPDIDPDTLSPQRIQLIGLNSFMQLDSPFTVEFEGYKHGANRREPIRIGGSSIPLPENKAGKETITQEFVVPIKHQETAYRLVNQFLAKTPISVESTEEHRVNSL